MPLLRAKPSAAGVALPSGVKARAAGGPLTACSRSGWRGDQVLDRDDQAARRAEHLQGAVGQAQLSQESREAGTELLHRGFQVGGGQLFRANFKKERRVESREWRMVNSSSALVSDHSLLSILAFSVNHGNSSCWRCST